MRGLFSLCLEKKRKKKGSFRYAFVVVKVLIQIFWDLLCGLWRFLRRQNFFLYINMNNDISGEEICKSSVKGTEGSSVILFGVFDSENNLSSNIQQFQIVKVTKYDET